MLLIEKRYTLLLTGGYVTCLSSPQKEPCVRQFVESVNVFCKEENFSRGQDVVAEYFIRSIRRKGKKMI